MERSKSQVLYQFLPENTFDYSGQRGIWKTTRLETSDASGTVSKEYILKRVLARVRNWEGGQNGFVSRNTDHYHFGVPEGVRAEPFPTTYECSKCEKVHGYYTADDVQNKNPGLTCRRSGCDGNLEQYQFVSVHTCGELRRLYPQKCPTHGDEHVVLDRRDSQRVRNFHWSCRVGGCSWETPIRNYQNCGCDYIPPAGDENDGMYTTVHRAGSVYYPHYISTVNLHTAGIGHLRDSTDGAKKAIARLFGLTDAQRIEDVNLNQRIGEVEMDDEKVVEVYSTHDDITTLDAARDYLREQGNLGSQTANERLGQLLVLDADGEGSELTEAGDEILQYVLSRESLTTETLPELESAARGRGFSDKADRISSYRDDLDHLGFDDVRVIEDFPVQTFVYGYTRGGREEDEAQITAFSQSASDGDGTPIFVDTSETEAVQFDLDPARVLLWLALNIPETSDLGAVNGDITLPEITGRDDAAIDYARSEIDALTTEEQWAFLLNHLAPVERYGRFQTDLDDSVEELVTEYVFKLVHTLSHILLKQASTISGFDRTNLSEFLFPRALSVVIYANNREEFNIGGMHTMVEQQLDNLLGQAESHGNECVYDPVCSQRGGACLSCLHVSEISCSFFNQVLSRDYLFGSRPNTDKDIDGYWTL
ncbi:hypothetical protein [Halomarina oriensis]|nr:hypothetical protein [Halomarina oriensis]